MFAFLLPIQCNYDILCVVRDMIKRQKNKLTNNEKKHFKEKIMLIFKNGYFISFMLSLLLGILIIGPSIIAVTEF